MREEHARRLWVLLNSGMKGRDFARSYNSKLASIFRYAMAMIEWNDKELLQIEWLVRRRMGARKGHHLTLMHQ